MKNRNFTNFNEFLNIRYFRSVESIYMNPSDFDYMIGRFKKIFEENEKLKAEIGQLKRLSDQQSELNIEQFKQIDNQYQEIERLKSELEQSVKLPCKVGDKYILIFNEYGELFKTIGWELTEITIIADDILLDFYCFSTEESEQRSLDSFGKTIFNTEEEAEQSLKGQV